MVSVTAIMIIGIATLILGAFANPTNNAYNTNGEVQLNNKNAHIPDKPVKEFLTDLADDLRNNHANRQHSSGRQQPLSNSITPKRTTRTTTTTRQPTTTTTTTTSTTTMSPQPQLQASRKCGNGRNNRGRNSGRDNRGDCNGNENTGNDNGNRNINDNNGNRNGGDNNGNDNNGFNNGNNNGNSHSTGIGAINSGSSQRTTKKITAAAPSTTVRTTTTSQPPLQRSNVQQTNVQTNSDRGNNGRGNSGSGNGVGNSGINNGNNNGGDGNGNNNRGSNNGNNNGGSNNGNNNRGTNNGNNNGVNFFQPINSFKVKTTTTTPELTPELIHCSPNDGENDHKIFTYITGTDCRLFDVRVGSIPTFEQLIPQQCQEEGQLFDLSFCRCRYERHITFRNLCRSSLD